MNRLRQLSSFSCGSARLRPSQFVCSDETNEKITSLHYDRRISEHLDFAGLHSKERKEIHGRLRVLQGSIYALDRYGESTWGVDSERLAELWGEIRQGLDAFGITGRDAEHLLSEMKAYQVVELGLREGKLPTELPIQRHYFLKTCDVRLSRLLIATAARRAVTETLKPAWNLYDLASEVCDDLADIGEDLFDFNCNRVLIETDVFGCLQTVRDYSVFLDSIRTANGNLARRANEFRLVEAARICSWTFNRINEAQERLRQLLVSQSFGEAEKPLTFGFRHTHFTPREVRESECSLV